MDDGTDSDVGFAYRYCCRLCHRMPRSKLHWLVILLSTSALIFVCTTISEKLVDTGTMRLSFGVPLPVRWSDKQCDCSTQGQIDAWKKSALPSEQFYVDSLNAKSPRRNDSFDPQINEAELKVTLRLLWDFLDLCKQQKIQVMLYGGTLLGSYRHHGVMPWDDDMDLLLKASDQERLETAINDRLPNVTLTKAGHWKVWNKSECLHKEYSWCWPYLDLSFYTVQDGKLYDTVIAYALNYSYPEQFAFPLHKRPFMGRWVDSPRDALRFLGFDKTPSDQCISLYYSHKFEGSPKSSVQYAKCGSLSVTFPFVVRVPDNDGSGILEVLRFHGGRPAYAVPVDEPPGAFNVEYSILPFK